MAKPIKSKKSNNSYLRYSGMAIQMIGLLLAAVWLGGKIDAYLELEVRYITVLLILLALIAYFVKLYYDLLRND